MSGVTEPTSITEMGVMEQSLGSQKTFLVPSPVLERSREVVAYLGPGVACSGEIWYDGNMQIDGQLEGNVYTKGTIMIGKQAEVKATIEAGTIVCQGKIFGHINAKEQTSLLSPGYIDGTLHTPQFSVEPGGTFNGRIVMNQQSSM